MTDWATLDDDPVTGDDLPTVILEIEGRTLELRNAFIGGTAPSSPVDGQPWIDNTSSPWKVYRYLKIDGGAAGWQPMGPLSRLPASINADPSITDTRAAPYEYKALRIENRASLPTVLAGNAGMLVYRTGDGEVWLADQPVSGKWKGLLSVTQDASYDTVELGLEGDLGNDATNPPTKTKSSVLEGWLFDATNEKRTFAFVVPKNWQGATDLKLRLHQVLEGAETAGDDIEWDGEWRTLQSAADKTGKAATACPTSTADIGSDADGIDAGGGTHLNELVIDHDDATNPVAAGCLVLVTVWRSSVGGAGLVSGTIVYRAELAYVQTPRHERA